MNEKRKRCDTCECYECDCEECSCDCHKDDDDIEGVPVQMIEFLLIFMIDNQIVNQSQRFKDINRCLYFAEKLHDQPTIPTEDGNKRITAYCKPVRK